MPSPVTISADDIPPMLESEQFAALPYERRGELVERALSEAGAGMAGQWTPEKWSKWGEFTQTVRGKVSAMETLTDDAEHYGGVLVDAGRGLARTAIAAAADLSPRNPDGSLRVPGKNIVAGVRDWLDKVDDTTAVGFSEVFDARADEFDQRLAALKEDIDKGNLPLPGSASADQLGEWLEARANYLGEAQAGWYDATGARHDPKNPEAWRKEQPDLPQRQSLMNPAHSALLRDYLHTRSPATWEALARSLAKTPQRLRVEAEESARLAGDPVVQFLDETVLPAGAAPEYGQHMQAAGDPLQLAELGLPAARAVGAASKGFTGFAAAAGKTAALNVGLGMANQVIQEPGSSYEDYKRTAKEMIAVGLGFHLAGATAGKVLGAVADARTLRDTERLRQGMRQQPQTTQETNPFEGDLPADNIPVQPTEDGGFVPPEDFASVNEVPPAEPGSPAVGTARNDPVAATDKTVGEARDVAGSTPAAGALLDEALPPDQQGIAEIELAMADTDLFGEPLRDEAPTAHELSHLPTQEVPLSELTLSLDVPQFKRNANAKGVVQPLGGTYRRLGTGPIVAWERLDGRKEVITGRHRFDLANRVKEKTIPTQIVREADGWTPDLAAALDAELNILDGQGEISDYANYIRNSGIDYDTAQSRGLLERAKGRAGWTIGTQSGPSLYALHENGRVTDAQAEAIARTAPRDDALQSVGAQAVLDGETIDYATNLMRAVRSELGGAPQASQLDLFGRDDRAMSEMRDMAKAAAALQRELRDQVSAVSGASKKPDQARKLGVDVKDPEAVQAKVAELKQQIDRWADWPLHEDLRTAVRERAGLAPKARASEMSGSLFDVDAAASTRPVNRGETDRPQDADPLSELGTAKREGEAERAQGKMNLGEELSRPKSGAAGRGPLPSAAAGQQPTGTPRTWSGEVHTLKGLRDYLVHDVIGLPRLGLKRMVAALGVYKVKPETIRLQAINDIPVLAHEVGHAIHFRELNVNGDRTRADDWGGVHDGELLPLGQPTSGKNYTMAQIRKEGVAEFTRLWLTDPATARAKAPQFSAFWEAQIAQKNPKLAEGLREAQRRIADYVAMPAAIKAQAQIVFNPAALKPQASVAEIVEQTYADFVDTLAPALNRLNEMAKADPRLRGPVQRQITLMENHRGGWASKAHADTAGQYQTDIHGRRVGKSLKSILSGIERSDYKEFSTYLALKRAAEIEASGRQSGFENARLPAAEMAALAARFEKTRQEVLAWSDNSLQLLVDSGLLSGKQAAAMRQAGRDYVPFYRLYEKLHGLSFGPEGAANSGGYVNLSSGIRRLKGSDRAIIDPIQSLMKNAFMFRKLAEQNQIGVGFFDVVKKLQGHGKYAEGIAPKSVPKTTSHKDVVQKLIDQGVIKSEADLPANADLTITLWEASKKLDTNQGEVIIWRNGEREHWEVKNAALMTALRYADNDSVRIMDLMGPTLTKALTLPTKVLRFGATGHPAFAIPNLFRDQFTAGTNSRAGYIPFLDGFRGAYHALLKTDKYRRWQEMGGEFSGVTTHTQAFTQLLDDVLPKDTVTRRAYAALKSPRQWVRALGAAGKLLEDATRVGEFVKATGRGMNELQAANASKFITLNFARAGEKGRAINMLSAFFNAKVQEFDMIVSNHRTRPLETLLKGVSFITVPSVLAWYLGRDDKEIQALPEWRKDLFWNFNLGDVARALGYKSGFILSLPKPFLMGQIYGTAVERSLDQATGRDPNGMRKAMKALLNAPSDIAETPLNVAGLRPLVEWVTNYDFYRGRNIVPDQLQHLPEEFQHDVFTSATARKLGALLGVAPLKVDHLLRGYFATAGRAGTDAIDWGMAKMGMVNLPPPPAKGLMESYVLNRFTGSPYAANAFVERFYKAAQDMEGKLSVFRKESDLMTTDEQARWWKQHGAEITSYQRITEPKTQRTGAGEVRKAQTQLAELTKAMKSIVADKTMKPEVKRSRLIELSDQRNRAAETAFRSLFPKQVRQRHW